MAEPNPDAKNYVDQSEPDQARTTVQTGSGTNIGHGADRPDSDEEDTKAVSSPGGGQRTDFSGVGDHGSNTSVPGSTSAPDVMAGGGATTPGKPPLPGPRLA